MSKKIVVVDDAWGITIGMVEYLQNEGLEITGVIPDYRDRFHENEASSKRVLDRISKSWMTLLEGSIQIVSSEDALFHLISQIVTDDTVLLLDHELGRGASGEEIAEHIRRSFPRIVIISISSTKRNYCDAQMYGKDSFDDEDAPEEYRKKFLDDLKKFL